MLLLSLIFLLPCVSGDLSKLDSQGRTQHQQCSEFKSMIVPVFSAASKSRGEKRLKVTASIKPIKLFQSVVVMHEFHVLINNYSTSARWIFNSYSSRTRRI